ncbi:MAG: TonB-dependent receptor [Flavobacteriales bacterium]|nr:TonB-dependent receptor [Flavobacteriales bacterium]MCB9448723.1 TonB-dependent receptor [Flavobacteriales bacterium]
MLYARAGQDWFDAMKRIALLLWMLPGLSFAQTCIQGKVVSDSLGTPVPFANVFIPERNSAASTDVNGHFKTCRLAAGTVQIQVTCIGYKTHISTIDLRDSVVNVTVQLVQSRTVYPEVVVYGTQSSKPDETPNNIVTLSATSMRNNGAVTLTEGIAQLPGVNQLSTGTGISKPVIRGLYGNRIQTVLSGMRFDNQQWQDEHGLGLSDIGVDRIEIIKGPASLLYGSEAMGGVLNIIEEKPAPTGSVIGDVSTAVHTNTYGNQTDAGIKGATDHHFWRLRIGEESHADYADGNGKRILNSRFDGYHVKGTYGWRGKRWLIDNSYLFSLSNYGFLMDAFTGNLTEDGRLSRNFDMPHHTVLMHMLTSRNTFYLKHSTLKVDAGTHLNNRQEQEGGNRISLNMQLNSHSMNLAWIRQLNEHTGINLGNQNLYQTNRNFGSRTIVPDANLAESSFFAYLKHRGKYVCAEGGIRYDLKHITTFETGTINTDFPNNPASDIQPVNKLYTSLNGAAGISLTDRKHLNGKLNLSTGYRAANLAELSSNGLHEGTVRYEIGNTDLKVEQNICFDSYLSYDTEWLTITASAYENHFLHYIYLAPTDDEYIGFRIYRYQQQNATLRGSEASAELHPSPLPWLSVKFHFATVKGRTDLGEQLPFIPASKYGGTLRLTSGRKGKLASAFVQAGINRVAPQHHPAQFETSTDGYMLMEASAGAVFHTPRHDYSVSLAGNNLLNEVYYDHLSRYKEFNIYNMGRNISLRFTMTFNPKQKP